MSIQVYEHQHFTDFDPFSNDFRANPEAHHERLLRASPGFMMMEGGIPSAYVAKFDQCWQILTNWEQFSSVKPANMPGMQRVDFFNSQPVMNYSDPPDHTRLRKYVNAAFTPGQIRRLSEAIRKIVDELLAGIKAGQSVDGFQDIARSLAVRMIFGEFLGVAPQDQKIFFDFAASFFLLDTLKPGEPKPKAYLDAWAKGEVYCRTAVERAAKEKTDEVSVLGLVAAASETGSMSDAEMMAMMCVLFTGGVPTISAAGGSALHYLARHPEIAQRIREDESRAVPFCEEVFRLDSPVTLVMRFATQDTEVGEQLISKGMPVYTMVSVACRDPDNYDRPLDFNIDRPNMRHLAFGSGVHFCIGATMARVALPILVSAVAKKLPNLRLDPSKPGTWETTARSRHRSSVPLTC